MIKLESKATPRPWRVIHHRDSGKQMWIASGQPGTPIAQHLSLEDAALIVAAVNAYDEARELVKRIAEKEVLSEYERQVVMEKARGVLRLMGEE